MTATDWPKVKLGELLTAGSRPEKVATDKEYRLLGVRLDGQGPFHRETVSGATSSANNLYEVKTGDFIYSRLFAWRGAFGLIGEQLDMHYVSNEFPIFLPNLSRLEPKFLFFWFRLPHVLALVTEKCTGSTPLTRNRFKETFFLEMEIPLPPVEEQRRLVAKIDALASKIEEAKRLREEADNEIDVLAELMVERVLSETGSFERVQLKRLCSKIGSGSTPTGGRSSYPSSGVPFVRSMNVRMRSFQWDDIAHISDDTHKSMSGTFVRPNDVLLNITGASIGRVACAPTELAVGNVNQHVAIVRPNTELVARYLMYWISQPIVQRHINDEQKGATRQGFTKKQIEELEIPVPPLDFQNRLVRSLDQNLELFSEMKRTASLCANEINALLPAILDRAFRGEL